MPERHLLCGYGPRTGTSRRGAPAARSNVLLVRRALLDGDYLIRSSFVSMRLRFAQSNVPFFVGVTRTNLPFCTWVRT
jgi:hypothetical protein